MADIPNTLPPTTVTSSPAKTSGPEAVHRMYNDPQFWKITPEQRANATRVVMAKHDPAFAKLTDEQQNNVAFQVLQKHTPAQPDGLGWKAAEIGIPTATSLLGEAGGAAIGGIGGPIGASAGAAVGAGAGNVLGDEIVRGVQNIAGYNVPMWDPKAEAQNFIAGAGGSLVGKGAAGAVKRVLGRKAAEQAAETAVQGATKEAEGTALKQSVQSNAIARAMPHSERALPYEAARLAHPEFEEGTLWRDNARDTINKLRTSLLKESSSNQAKVAQVNRLLPSSMMEQLDKASTLPEMGSIIFKNTNAARLLIKGAGQSGQDTLRDMFTSYVFSAGEAPEALAKQLKGQDEIVKSLFGDRSLGTIKEWLDTDKALTAWKKEIETSPRAQAEYQAGVKDAYVELAKRRGLQASKLPPQQGLAAVRSGDPIAVKAANDAIQKRAQQNSLEHYLVSKSLLMHGAALAGGGYEAGHLVLGLIGEGVIMLKREAWGAAMSNPTAANLYRQAIFSKSAGDVGYWIGRAGIQALAGAGQDTARPPGVGSKPPPIVIQPSGNPTGATGVQGGQYTH